MAMSLPVGSLRPCVTVDVILTGMLLFFTQARWSPCPSCTMLLVHFPTSRTILSLCQGAHLVPSVSCTHHLPL